MIDLLFDWFGNVPLCSTKISAPSTKNIAKPEYNTKYLYHINFANDDDPVGTFVLPSLYPNDSLRDDMLN